jgi:hypothetical protein
MYEASIGVKGDYYFCTGALRTFSGNQQAYIDSVRRAVELYGATIGSHNGGYPNIGVSDPDDYFYWHWGPDELIDATSGFPDPYGSYTSGYDYSRDSIQISFQDLEGWLAGLDNGRLGCGAAGNCPRTWASPFFNASRDRSARIVSELGSITAGEQKISPFPHRTLSYDPATPGRRYNTVSIPTSEWYLDGLIRQAIEGHTDDSIRALVDFYHQQGYLVNLYGHLPSDSGLMKTYVDWAVGKTRMWSTNSVGLRDWYVARETLQVTPTVSRYGNTAIAAAAITGAADPQAAIELVLPNWAGGAIQDMTVYLNGVQAAPAAYRTTSYGVKVLVGTTVSNVQVVYSTESPSAVTLSAFSADAQPRAIRLNWETVAELDLLGFNLYRSESANGPRQKLNAALITGKKPGQMAGAAYQFADTVPAGRQYYYWLEVVGRDETTTEGPVVISSNHLMHIPLTIH